MAEDTAGNTTKKKLKFKEGGKIPNALDDYKLSFGDSVTAVIPGNIPVIGGTSVGLDLPMIPLTVTFEDNKFYAVLGLDVVKASEEYSFIQNVNGKYQENYKQETKYLFENIKDSFTKSTSTDTYNIKKLKAKWNKAKYNYSAKVGFEADLTVIGYMEGYVDSNGKISVLDGGVGINPYIKISAGSQIIPVPPLYWEAELKGEIEAMASVYLNETAKNFSPNGSLGGSVTLKGGVGLGASGVIGVSGGVNGNIGVDWDIYKERQDYVAISGSIGAYVKAFAGPITFIDKSFPFAEGIIWDYPSTKVKMLSLDEINYYDTTEYKLIDRSYAESDSCFVANESGIMSFSFVPQNKIEKTIKTNVYTYSEPQLKEFSDGTMLSVWIDDDATREDINRTALYYSFYDGSDWSEPEQLYNDRTGDYSPNLKIINDTAYIAWVNAKSELSNDADISEVFNVWEIQTAQFDKSNKTFTNISTVTDDTNIDMSPKIFGDESGVHVAWVQNTSDDIFSKKNTYSVQTSTLTNGSWSGESVYADNLMPIDSLDGCVYNGTTYIAYSLDLDGNQSDYTDKEVYLNNTRITNNEVLDSKPVFSNGKLYYYSNGKIVEYNICDSSDKTIVDMLTTDRFNVISDGENSAIVYGQSDWLITELYAIMYDSTTNKWGKSIALTEFESNISSYSGVFTKDGNMNFVINKTEITGDINSVNPYGQTDIALFTVIPSYNLSIGETVYHEELLMAGNTVEFYTNIINNGELSIDNYIVQIIDENNTVIRTNYGKEPILPGQAVDFTVYYPLANEEFIPHNITIAVKPIGVEDFDESDNFVDLYLNCENIALENLDYGINEEGSAVIYADVVNRGYSVPDSITATLYKNDENGTVVDTVTINEQLSTFGLSEISFTVPFENDVVYYVKLNKEGKNSDFVVLQNTMENDLYFDITTNKVIINSNEKISDVALVIGVYNDGRLLKLQTNSIDIEVGENTYNSPITDFSGATEVKVFVFENTDSLQPLFNSYNESL